MKRDYMHYEEYPYFDMKRNCGCNPCNNWINTNPKPCKGPPNFRPPCANPIIPSPKQCCNSELLLFLSGIIVGKYLD